MTPERAVNYLTLNKPSSGYPGLCEALDMAIAALRSRPAPPDDLVPVTRAQLASIEWALYVDTQRKCPVCDALRRSDVHAPDCWLAAALAASAPVAAPAPVGESPLAHAAVEATARAHGWDAESDTLAGWLHARLLVAAPAPETRVSYSCPHCGREYDRPVPAPETPAPDAMPPAAPETPDPAFVASCEGCPYPDTCSWFRRCTFRR